MLPAIHRATATPVFISVLDDVWNQELIAREERLISGVDKPAQGEVVPWTTIDDHPMTRYWSGESRGDLATVRQYMLPDKTPTAFRCRPLPLPQWVECKQLHERRLTVAFTVACIRHGVVELDNAVDEEGKPLEIGGSPLSNDAIQTVRRVLGDQGFELLAAFIWRCSEEPTPTEVFR